MFHFYPSFQTTKFSNYLQNDGEVVLAGRAEDFVQLPDLLLILKVYRRVKVGHLEIAFILNRSIPQIFNFYRDLWKFRPVFFHFYFISIFYLNVTEFPLRRYLYFLFQTIPFTTLLTNLKLMFFGIFHLSRDVLADNIVLTDMREDADVHYLKLKK